MRSRQSVSFVRLVDAAQLLGATSIPVLLAGLHALSPRERREVADLITTWRQS